MIQKHSTILMLLGLTVGLAATQAEAGWPWGRNYASNDAAYHASQLPWHGGFAYQNYQTPVAMVVPPTSNMQTNYAWGVPSSRMTPVYHQFNREYPGGISGDPGTLGVTPYQPSNTRQFGVYNVRGPWNFHAHDLGYGGHLWHPDLGYGWHLGPHRGISNCAHGNCQ